MNTIPSSPRWVPVLFALFVGPVVRGTPRSPALSPATMELGVATAVHALPAPLRGCLEARIEPLREAAARSNAQRRSPRQDDVGADVQRLSVSSGEAALLDRIVVSVRALAGAFRSGNGIDIAAKSGDVICLAMQAAMPLGEAAAADVGRECIVVDPPSAARSDRTVADRFRIGLMDRLARRLSYEVRVAAERYSPAVDPVPRVSTVLRSTRRASARVAELDQNITFSLGLTSGREFDRHRGVYYERFANRAGDLAESRLEAGALLAADLIGGAWVAAGEPDLPTGVAGIGPGEKATGDRWVASRQSNIYHRTGCAYATRIRPENRVQLTWEQIRASGRSACKRCSSDSGSTDRPASRADVPASR